MDPITLIDGPLGSQLERRGWALPAPAWSARVVGEAPEVLAELHQTYAAAGATVHTACTFRTTPRGVGEGWQEWMEKAVQIAKSASQTNAIVAGSLAPLEDCYEPWRSPAESEAEFRTLAEGLASSGVDLILCETFANPIEARTAVAAALSVGLPVWLSMTAGPFADLLSPVALARGLVAAADQGVAAVLINCISADRTLPFVRALADALRCGGHGRLPFGVYANGGRIGEGYGCSDPTSVAAYLEHAMQWRGEGASIFGGCCGTGPEHIRGLHRAFIENRSLIP